jgi:hypothetical protein
VLKYKANTLNHLTQTLNEWVSNCCLTPSGQFNFQLFHDVNKLYFDKDDDVCFTEKQQMHVPISLSLVSGLELTIGRTLARTLTRDPRPRIMKLVHAFVVSL